MTRPEFPDLLYLSTKMYEGLKRQDFAQLSAVYCTDIREQLQKYKPLISNSVDQVAYDSTVESVMRRLTELERYFQNFDKNKSRISRKTAGEHHTALRKELDALKEISTR